MKRPGPARVSFFVVCIVLVASSARAVEALCDPSVHNCRTQLLTLIQNEKVRIDVAFWFMQDTRYSAAILKRWQAGIPVRILVDPRANPTYAGNAEVLAQFKQAGIPMRMKSGGGILHWKMMLFAGQETVEFGSANFSPNAFVPISPLTNYVDESIYYTDDPSLVNSFKTAFDNCWISTTSFKDYANITAPLVRHYPIYPIDPELNFPPSQDYAKRAVSLYNQETTGIDAIMFRITDRRHTDAIINAHGRGVPVRLIVENKEYRDPNYLWDAWNVDRLYMAGVRLRWRGHGGQNHEKLVLLRGLATAIFGSSNWTTASANSQIEHNLFTRNSSIVAWFQNQFQRMWANTSGTETVAFKPLPPNVPKYKSPANGSIATAATTSTTATVILKWYGGPWAHDYDVYLGAASTPPRVAADLNLGPSPSTSANQTYTVALRRHTTYYWRIVSKTMANLPATGEIWSFTTP